VWSADSNGNWISDLISNVSANSSALESIETTFHQDLNGDGVIGVPTIVSQPNAATSVAQIGSNYFLYTNGSGPELKFVGSPYTAGEFGSWSPFAAVQTASGYDVAWKNASSDTYTVWSADSNGNWISDLISNVSANSSALESIETTFHQDLNGDGVIGVPPAATSPITANNATVGSNPVSAAAAINNDSFVFAPNFGHVTITNDASLTGINFSHEVFANINALFSAARDDGHGNVVITDAVHDTLTIQNMTSQQLHTHQAEFHIV
jgi:hypothetical protein